MENILKSILNTDHICVICPYEIKKQILSFLSNNNLLKDIKWFDRNQFISFNTYTLKQEANIKASLFFGREISIIDEMICYMPYIDITNVDGSTQLKEIISLKKYLINQDLIIENTDLSLLHQRDIYVIGYSIRDRLFNKLLSSYQYHTIEFPDHQNPIALVKHSNELSEVIHLSENIAKLIDDGISPKNIKVYTTNETYIPFIESIFNRYQLKANFTFNKPIISYQITKLFQHTDFDNKNTSDVINDLYEAISKLFSSNHEDISKKLISLLNKYLHIDAPYSSIKPILMRELKSIKINYESYENGIIVGNITSLIPTDDDHVFMIGMNANEISKVAIDHDFLSDFDKQMIGMETSLEKTNLNKKILLDFINHTKHMTMSYKEISNYKEAYLSPIVDDISRSINASSPIRSNIRYSMKQDTLILKKHLDVYKTYGSHHDDISTLYQHLHKNIPNDYDHKMDTLKQDTLIRLLNKKNTLSYSNLNTYFECPFKFMLKHLIKIDPFDMDTLSLHIGNFYHDVLKDYKNFSEDIEQLQTQLNHLLAVYMESLENDLDHKDTFYLKHSLEQLFQVIVFLKEIDARSSFKVHETEKNVELEIGSTYIKKLIGKIDKIMTLDEQHHTLYIVDYKTGKADQSLNYIHKGLYAQLMFYLLFIYKQKDNPTFIGFFYQNINAPLQKAQQDKDYISILREKWSLNGYHISEPSLVTQIDPEFSTYKTLSRYALKNDQTPKKTSWVYKHEDLIKLLLEFETYILKEIDKIENGHFPISPIYLDDESYKKAACKYCNFKDLCYVKKTDFIHVSKQKVFESEDES